MMRVVFDPDQLQDAEQKEWWEKWRKRAAEATDEVIDAFETWFTGDRKEAFHYDFKPKTKIWSDLKTWLTKNVFYKRCAYCECAIPPEFYEDAEHFRPKAAVSQLDARGKKAPSECILTHPDNDQDLCFEHPGYFWLAFDWRNLLPSCKACNEKSTLFDTDQPHVLLVKLDPAEVANVSALAKPRESKRWPSYYYLSPSMLDETEHPLLLNPMNATDERDPKMHIRYGVRGIVSAVDGSKLGETTIKILGLKDEDRRQQRQDAQERFQLEFFTGMANSFDPSRRAQSKPVKLLAEYEQGKKPYSKATLDYYAILRQSLP